MPRCFTCGSKVDSVLYNCPTCLKISKIEGVSQKINEHGKNLTNNLDSLAKIQINSANLDLAIKTVFSVL